MHRLINRTSSCMVNVKVLRYVNNCLRSHVSFRTTQYVLRGPSLPVFRDQSYHKPIGNKKHHGSVLLTWICCIIHHLKESMHVYCKSSYPSSVMKTPLRSSLVLDRISMNVGERNLWYTAVRCRSYFCGNFARDKKVSSRSSVSRFFSIGRTTQQFECMSIPQRMKQSQRMIVSITKTNASSNTGSDEPKSLSGSASSSTSSIVDRWNPSSESTTVHITDSCLKRIHALAQKRSSDNPNSIYLRVLVDAGGCSGFQYKFELEDDSRIEVEDDIVVTSSDSMARVVVDKESLQYIRGSTIDYVDSMMKSSFEVRDNPNSEKACGCGSSFAIKKFQANPVSH